MTATERAAIARLLDDPELVRHGELLAVPIDFDSLVAAGVLKRRGHWWQILDRSHLPEHAWLKVRALRDSRKKGETWVQFERIRPQVAAMLLAKLKRGKHLAWHIEQREFLLTKCLEENDHRTAEAVRADLAKLRGSCG